jgi:integrase/recombinase XerC
MLTDLKAFLQFLRLNRNASAHTVRAYDSDLSQFLSHTAKSLGVKRSDLTPPQLDRQAIRGFMAELHRLGQSRASAARKLASIRTFLRYLRREERIEDDPGALVPTPKRDVRMPAHLSERDMAALLEAPDNSPLGNRDRAILELFYASGLRLSELVGLDLDDVNLSQQRMVRVLGKGGKQRIVPFNQSTATALRAYLKDRSALVEQEGQGRPGGAARAGRKAGSLPLSRSSIRELPRRTTDGAQRRSPGQALRRGNQRADRNQSARPAPLVCDAPAAARRRPARDSGAARSRTSQHDAAIHARQCRAVVRGVPKVASEGW